MISESKKLADQIEIAIREREKELESTIHNWGDGTYDANKAAVEMACVNLRIVRKEIIPPLLRAHQEAEDAKKRDALEELRKKVEAIKPHATTLNGKLHAITREEVLDVISKMKQERDEKTK